MTIKPLNDRVLIEPAKAEEVVGGIIIPDSAKEKPLKGKVIAVGNGTKDEEMVVKAGDKLEFSDIRKAVEGDGRATVKCGGRTFRVAAVLSDRERHLVLCGGLLASLK